MIRWVKSWRLEKTQINSEFHQPSTTNRILRQFFGHMATYHDWKLRVAHDFNFQGGLHRFLKDIYQERLESDTVSAKR